MPCSLLSTLCIGRDRVIFVSKIMMTRQLISIIAPHPDDELLLFGPLIEQYRQAGYLVEVVYVTYGDYKADPSIRVNEAIRSCKKAKISHVWLGYPDHGKGMDTEANIYNSKLVYQSSSMHQTTYSAVFSPWSYFTHGIYRPYIKESLLADLIDYFLCKHPSVIVTTDWDEHPDHRICSLVVEESLRSIVCSSMGSKEPYRPVLLKTFAYLGKWYGEDDYYDPVPRPTQNMSLGREARPFPYSWENRLSIPVNPKEYALAFWKSPLFRAFSQYRSQTGYSHFFMASNSDAVFWARDLNNVALQATIKVSSGNASPINDFKLIDSSNVRRVEYTQEDLLFSSWTPRSDDVEKSVLFSFPCKVRIKRIVIHQSFNPTHLKICVYRNKTFLFAFTIEKTTETIDLDNEITTDAITLVFAENSGPIIIREIELYPEDHRNDQLQTFIQDAGIYHVPYRPKVLRILSRIIRSIYVRRMNRKRKSIQKPVNEVCRIRP